MSASAQIHLSLADDSAVERAFAIATTGLVVFAIGVVLFDIALAVYARYVMCHILILIHTTRVHASGYGNYCVYGWMDGCNSTTLRFVLRACHGVPESQWTLEQVAAARLYRVLTILQFFLFYQITVLFILPQILRATTDPVAAWFILYTLVAGGLWCVAVMVLIAIPHPHARQGMNRQLNKVAVQLASPAPPVAHIAAKFMVRGRGSNANNNHGHGGTAAAAAGNGEGVTTRDTSSFVVVDTSPPVHAHYVPMASSPAATGTHSPRLVS